MLLLLQIFHSGLPSRNQSENTHCNNTISIGLPTNWMNNFLWTIENEGNFFQLILLNLTVGISTHFNIKWKFKSYPCHSTNEDHIKENRKWGIIIIQWKNFCNMDRKVHKPEIRPQKILFFFSFNKVLSLVPGCKEDQDEISALSELSSVSYF